MKNLDHKKISSTKRYKKEGIKTLIEQKNIAAENNNRDEEPTNTKNTVQYVVNNKKVEVVKNENCQYKFEKPKQTFFSMLSKKNRCKLCPVEKNIDDITLDDRLNLQIENEECIIQ